LGTIICRNLEWQGLYFRLTAAIGDPAKPAIAVYRRHADTARAASTPLPPGFSGPLGPSRIQLSFTHDHQGFCAFAESLMFISEKVARTKWCPLVRIDNNNRLHNSLTGGFQNTYLMYHCIGADCMGWRQLHLSHLKGDGEVTAHGYCGFAGKPEHD
jgi:hypothetical protein